MNGQGLTPARLSEIRARAEAATIGAWRNYTVNSRHSDMQVVEMADPSDLIRDPEVATGLKPRDAEFISAARQDVPDLLAEVDRLTAALAEARAGAWDEGAQAVRDRIQEYDDRAMDDPANPYRQEAQK